MADPMKIIVDVVNGQKVKDLTEEIKRQEKEILTWNAAMKTAGTTQQQVLQTNMMNAAKAIGTARTELAQLQTAGSSAGRGLSQLSYAIDDVQYGFNAIVNNIPQIVMGLGGSAGIAGGVGIAAVAINQLIKHWGELTDAMKVAWSGGSIDQLTKLREKADEATAAFEKLEKVRPKSEQQAGAGVSGLITEGPTEKMLKSAMEALGKDIGLGALPHAAVAPGIGGGPGVIPTPGMTPEQAEKKRQEDNFEIARKLLGAASTGDPEAMKKLEGLVARNPGNFPPEFLQDIRDMTPEGQKRIAQGRLEAQGQHNARVMDQEEKDRKEKEKEQQNRWEIEGRNNAKKSDKDTVIRGLEDERTRVQRAQRDFDDKMWERQQGASRGSVMGGGAKALIDMYQAGAPGRDDPKALAKEAHAQRERTIKALEKIEDQMKEARKIIIK